jgi:HK97 gp10 family phage protein
VRDRAEVVLTGEADLIKELKRLNLMTDRAVTQAVQIAAQAIRGNAQKSIQSGPKTGRVYEKYKPSRTHQASAPGQAPATDTGILWNSIVANISGKTAEVIANAEYAAPLEFGTSRIQPRPFMIPAMEKERPAFNRRLSKILQKAQEAGK